MNKRIALCLLSVFLFATVALARAQHPAKIPRIGYLSGTGNASNQGPFVDALRQGLQDLGYIEGKNIVIEYRGADGKADRIPSLVNELVQLQLDVLIVPTAQGAIHAAKQATQTIPIIMVTLVDPVADGLVDSLARPGGNITGVATLQRDLSGKRLELLAEVVPKISRVAVLRDTGSSFSRAFEEYETVARALKINLQSLEVRGPDLDLDGAFQAAVKASARGVITITSSLLFRNSKRITDLAIKNRLPSMYEGQTWTAAGGLMSYSANDLQLFRRAATYVDKILKGAKPADLPVERSTKFEFLVNLKAAKQIGLTIPPNVLARADRVIR